MTNEQVRTLVEKRAKPSWREWGRVNGVHAAHLSEFMAGKRGPSNDLLAALNLEYRIVRRARAALPADGAAQEGRDG